MPNVLVNDESLSAIGSAIRDKNGTVDTYKPSEMAQAIRDIPQSGFVEAPDNDVIFIDAYGNRLYSYTYEESKNLTELPPLPVDEDIEFDRWNWSLEDLHNNDIYKTDVVIGPIPKIGEREVYVWVDIQKERYDSIKILFGGSSFIGNINWGDSESDAVNDRNITHTYKENGIYKIILSSDYQFSIIRLSVGDSILNKWENDLFDSSDLRGYIKKLIVGTNIGFGDFKNNYAVEYCYGITSATYLGIKSLVLKENIYQRITLNESGQLKYISIPFKNDIKGIGCLYCTSLRKIMIPVNVTEIQLLALGFDIVDLTHIDRIVNMSSLYFSTYPTVIKVPAKYFDVYYNNFISKLPNSIVPIGNYLKDISSVKSLFNSITKIEAEYISSDNTIPSVTITSTNPEAVEFSNITVLDGKIEFDLITKEIEDKVTITVNADFNGEIQNKDFTVNIKESFPTPTYTVEDVSGASYNFAMNDSGYYESTNKNIQNSASVCKVTFNNAEGANITFNCINYAEANYDYGIIGKPNVELTLNSTDDGTTGSAKVLKSFKGLSTATVLQFTFSPAENEFFIYIKYIKDGSGDSNNDSFLFNIEFS